MLRSTLTTLFTLSILLSTGCSDSSDGNKDSGIDGRRASDMRRIEGPVTHKIHDLAPMPDWTPLADQATEGQDGGSDLSQ